MKTICFFSSFYLITFFNRPFFTFLQQFTAGENYKVAGDSTSCGCISTTLGFPAKWRLRNERKNSILMTRHYPDLGSASDWSCRVGNLIQPIRSTTQIWVVTRHQYGISALVSQTSFGGETRGSVAKCWLFSQAKAFPESTELLIFSHTVIMAGYLTVTAQLDCF